MNSNFNDFDKLAGIYQRSSAKPDKLFSTLPTVRRIAGDVTNKTVVDLGCGDGFFANEFAIAGAKKVIGIDNAPEQIKLAKQKQLPNTEYILGSIFDEKIPTADIIIAPYVVNYAKNNEGLRKLFESMYASLATNGKVIMVVDLPEGKDLKKFGAVKKMEGNVADGAKMDIELYNERGLICILHAIYFTPATIENILQKIGFKNITWHKPIISKEGLEKLGGIFWGDYLESPEIGYISATKK